MHFSTSALVASLALAGTASATKLNSIWDHQIKDSSVKRSMKYIRSTNRPGSPGIGLGYDNAFATTPEYLAAFLRDPGNTNWVIVDVRSEYSNAFPRFTNCPQGRCMDLFSTPPQKNLQVSNLKQDLIIIVDLDCSLAPKVAEEKAKIIKLSIDGAPFSDRRSRNIAKGRAVVLVDGCLNGAARWDVEQTNAWKDGFPISGGSLQLHEDALNSPPRREAPAPEINPSSKGKAVPATPPPAEWKGWLAWAKETAWGSSSNSQPAEKQQPAEEQAPTTNKAQPPIPRTNRNTKEEIRAKMAKQGITDETEDADSENADEVFS